MTHIIRHLILLTLYLGYVINEKVYSVENLNDLNISDLTPVSIMYICIKQ